MTLIEVLYHFRAMTRKYGQEWAREEIKRMCDESIWDDIFMSVDENGNFLKVDDETCKIVPFDPSNI